MCAELNRGGNQLERASMNELVSLFSNSIMRCYDELFTTIVQESATPRLSQDGAVQLLFDINFIADVLNARATHDVDEGRAYQTRLESLRTRCKEAIDPFDMIVYEKPLQESRARFYMRCEVLLGPFIRLNRLHVGVKAALTASDRDNMIALAPTVPRFPLLPISASKSTSSSVLVPTELIPRKHTSQSLFESMFAL
jgi:hypothetical protein